ncbi:hypothetical protein DB30_00961 [Enhygromyxa salina]|uniref:DUF362 domain-containing protein n=1 Tax=Enhygromyxa salina TaxID=215803 RepID=A0A0C1ZPA0_9BACT|nr:hypothetical protein [Enhygromyxa salina]KIG12843.1 hypothetical protein DB30_00961 [Enhygromyxa salina]
MRAQLHVHAGQPRSPERAAQLIAAELAASFPRQRQVTLAIVALGPHPGLTPTPWMLDGLLAALVEAERTPVNFVTIGDHQTGEALLRKAGRQGPVRGAELIERPNRDRRIDLRVGGHARPLSVLREVVGSSLIVCAPLCFGAHDLGPVRHWQGPIAGLLASFAEAQGFTPATPKLRTGLRPRVEDSPDRAAVTAGLELLGACFASAAVLLDGTWAAAVEPTSKQAGRGRAGNGRFITLPKLSLAATREPKPPTLLGELATCDRALGVGALNQLTLASVLGVDRWLAAALGLDSRTPDHSPELVTSPGRWPTLSLAATRSQPPRLADRAIAGIRSQTKRLRAPLPNALPAPVPGEFAALWTQRWYGEHELGRPRLASQRSPTGLR